METGLLRYAWRNLRARRRRTLITLTAVSLSLMLSQCYQNLGAGVYGQMVDSGVRAGSGHAAIYATGYLSERDPKRSFDGSDLAGRIATLPGVRRVLTRSYLPALAQSTRDARGVMIQGIDFKKEESINPFLDRIVGGSLPDSDDRAGAVIGVRLLEELELRPGARLVVTAQGIDGELRSELLRVRGVIETGLRSTDGGMVFVSLPMADRIGAFGGKIHELAILMGSSQTAGRRLPEIQALIGPLEGVEAVPWERAMPNLANAIRLDYGGMQVLLFILLLIVTIGMVNTTLMGVMERIREFGIILAVGATPARLRRMVFAEALMMGILGACAGTLLGTLASAYMVYIGVDLRALMPSGAEYGGVIFDPVLRARWRPAGMAVLAALIPTLSVLAALYPALRAARITPVKAIRHT